MRFRFRIGPFTFGRSGTRLSLWSRGSGLSVPLTGKGQTFGKIGIGPLSGYFGGSPTVSPSESNDEDELQKRAPELLPYEDVAIEALRSDGEFLRRLQEQGAPWRGIQERLKQSLPSGVPNQDQIAYELVPKAMDHIFGLQGAAWTTEKRPSKRTDGYTTWIVAIDAGA